MGNEPTLTYLADLIAMAIGATPQRTDTHSWTFTVPPSPYPIERMTISTDDDGRVLIDAVTGKPFDIQAFMERIVIGE